MSEHETQDHTTGFSGAELAAELEHPRGGEQIQPHEYRYLAYDRADHPGEETSAELRARYVLYTDKMIAEVKELSDPQAEPGQDGLKDTGVTMVFLDKSARPTYWMMNELWDLYAPGYRKPDIKFVNIDREQWQHTVGRIDPDNGTNDVDVNRLGPDTLDDLRSVFTQPESEESMFAGRNVMIVDETMTTGTTLEIARQMFTKAFPDAKGVSGYHWMVRPKLAQKTADVPIWYDSSVPYGRGVNDINRAHSTQPIRNALNPSLERERDPRSAQVRGAGWLSTPPEGGDAMADGIRRELHYIREDMLNGAMRFSVVGNEDDDIDPKLLAAVEPWRAKQRAENARH